jgi:hypothetical protein
MNKALKKNISIKSYQARRIVMKRTIISLVVFASMFVVGAVPKLQAGKHEGCSNASLQGGYGFHTGGIILPAGTPSGHLGRWVFDGKGNFTNTLTLNNNGTVIHVTDSGVYTVNTDCTGKIFILGGTGTIEIVLVDGGKEFYSLATNPSFLVNSFSVAKKQFPDE